MFRDQKKPSLFLSKEVAAFSISRTERNQQKRGETNVLTVFRDYLRQDPEEEVLPCRRGYVRISWNSDSRYCVDGVLCRTPEELFDLLLQDYWDFELIRRTQGRREATETDEKAVDELCQPYLDWRKEALK